MATKNKKIKNGLMISDPVKDTKAIAQAMRAGLNTFGGFYKDPTKYNRTSKHKGLNNYKNC